MDKWTVETPAERSCKGKQFLFKCDMRSWHRIVAEDGSTVGFAPDIVTARQFAASPDLFEACEQIVWKVFNTSAYPEIRKDVVIRMAEASIAKAKP